jgi:hypothetical protein
MPNRSENEGMNFGFEPKQAWARRGDGWKGRNEQEHIDVFHQF